MPISHKHKLIFIHVPKNGGTAISKAEGMAFTLIGHHYPQFYMRGLPTEWDTFTKFGVVRNPWSRTVSNYEYAKMAESYWHSVKGFKRDGTHPDYNVMKDMSFTDAIHKLKENPKVFKHHGWEAQHKYLCDTSGKVLVDKVFRLEELATNEEFKVMVPNLQVINQSDNSHIDYKDYYDEETKGIIAEVYAKDIELFNYEF
jgi:hypothetical protein